MSEGLNRGIGEYSRTLDKFNMNGGVLETGGEGPLGSACLPHVAGGAEEIPSEILPDEEVQPGHEKLPPDEEMLLMKLCRPG